ncbi:kinesin-like protein KIN-7D, mitochondrial isoform X2 [Solanum pennellii]|uniref:Kinesin-like protein KIN-7D, mitochondrial isoform X2 n=1 Tax=Solanum pennellii TaxID=28526 RepID=A0ABM1VHR2_SOLPN|nr:kinesin-like protein KIN-7D, mitochondrial isoform X2 [Solanum pennellii]
MSRSMSGSLSRGRSTSPFHHRKPSSPYSSTSSSSSFMNGRLMPRSNSSTATSMLGSGTGVSSKSVTPGRNRSNSEYSRGYGNRTPVSYQSTEELIAEPVDMSRAGESISVTVRFRPLSEREYNKGDEIAWYPDGDKIVRNEYNAGTAFAFDRVFGPDTYTQEVYEVAARPVVKAAMEGINGTVFAYGVTSSGKTHTMHTPGREFLLRVSYLEIYNEVINDLLDPTGQNLRVREDTQGTYVEGMKEEVVLSPGHALSFIAAGEEHRHVGSNNFNLFSSRSHTIFTLMIESSAHGDEYDGVIFSQLNLIDLAGSESSKTETTGLRRKEGSYINKSLLTLGTVIGKLSEGKAFHVPYRDSKLTRLLQSSLSGHGHVSLICTITPASSNMEETHNTLKFASRAKRVEIYASRNKIIDEKSLIKKYQKEICCLKEELDQLKRGMLVGVNHEELMTLKQQLEEGQVKMQSRLEEEEDAKAALLSRIQKLTKLILVSSKNSIPGSRFASEDDKLNGSVPIDSENQRDSSSETSDFKHGGSSSKWNDDVSQAGSVITESTQGGDLVTGSKLPIEGVSLSDQMDLLVEQVKMLAGEIAFSTSTLKRMTEQSVNDLENSKSHIEIQSLERDIEGKREQMRILEQRIVESGEVSISSASLVEMQQTLMKLMTQCSEKGFELEIKSADNRILQEELQNKCLENKELQETIYNLEQQLAAVKVEKSYPSTEQRLLSDKYIDDLEKKIQLQDIENDKLKLQLVQSVEESSGLRVQNQKLFEETSYAKELASAAAVELKNLAGEVTSLSIQNTKLEKELLAARQALNSMSTIAHTGNVRHRKHGENLWQGRRSRVSDRESEVPGVVRDGLGTWDLGTKDLKMELQARKQREAVLEAALVEKEILEDEYRKKVEEGKRREAALENDLANMWVLVSQLRKKNGATQDVKTVTERQNFGRGNMNDPETFDSEYNDPILDDEQTVDHATSVAEILKEDPLVARLKARMHEMKVKDHTYVGNADANSHVCKVCFESLTSAMLLPCRHFCLCKSCSLACAECPICRTEIADRIFVFT